MNQQRKKPKKFKIKITEDGLKFSDGLQLSFVLNTLLTYCFMIVKRAGLPYEAIQGAFCAASAEFYPEDYFPSDDEIKVAEKAELDKLEATPTEDENYMSKITDYKAKLKERMNEC